MQFLRDFWNWDQHLYFHIRIWYGVLFFGNVPVLPMVQCQVRLTHDWDKRFSREPQW